MTRAIALRATMLTLVALALWAHGGGIDASGGHTDRKAGNYHFHQGPLAGRSFSSKTEALSALNVARKPAASKVPSTPATSARPLVQGTAPATAAIERTVYITKTGKKYHGPNCSSLRSSKIPISLKDALGRGFTECAICRGR